MASIGFFASHLHLLTSITETPISICDILKKNFEYGFSGGLPSNIDGKFDGECNIMFEGSSEGLFDGNWENIVGLEVEIEGL